MSEYTYDEDIFSDLYKDVNGFRPRSHEFYDATPARKQEIWESLLEDLDRENEYQRQLNAEAVISFERILISMITMGAPDRLTAIKWLVDAEDDFYDYGYMEYNYGLPYGYILKEFPNG